MSVSALLAVLPFHSSHVSLETTLVRYVFTLRCPDQPGIVRAFADGVFESQGNLVDNKQFSDPDSGTFCMRSVFDAVSDDIDALRDNLGARLAAFEPITTLRRETQRRRMLVMVSKHDHCLLDLLYRHDA